MISDKDFIEWNSEDTSHYQLRLFVAGTSSLSIRAIENLNTILAEHLKGKYDLEVVDIYQQPLIALHEDVTAVPMLLKKFPAPSRKLIGDMSDTAKVLRGLGIK